MALRNLWEQFGIHTGSRGTPEFGASERLQSIFRPSQAYASSGGSQLFGGQQTPQAPTQDYSSLRGTMPAQTVSGGGGAYTGGGGAGAGAPAQQQAPEMPGRNIPSQEEHMSGYDFQGAIQPALEALSQQEGVSRSGYETALGQAERTGGQQKTEMQTEESRRLGELGQQRTEAKQTGESAMSEARRTTSELMQGIQARFGGTTGTGKFTSEIMGAAGATNIAQNRQAMQNTMSKIGMAEENVRKTTTDYISQINNQMDTAKENAKQQLDQALSNINSQRGALQSQKAQMQMDVLQNFQSMISNINSQYDQFQQDLFMQAQKATDQLTAWKEKAVSQNTMTTEGFEPDKYTVGDKEWQNVGGKWLSGSIKDKEDPSAAGSVKL